MKNLLENSLRHGKRERLEIALGARLESGSVLIRYRDNGPGYQGDIRKLGQIFQKGAGSQGAGVGLYLICVLTEQMGGSVRFDSNEGFETRITLKEAKVHGG